MKFEIGTGLSLAGQKWKPVAEKTLNNKFAIKILWR